LHAHGLVWYSRHMTTTRKTTHANCFHDNTKADRASCRRDRAKWEADKEAYDNEFLRPLREFESAQSLFDKMCEGVDELIIAAAGNNADDTSVEEGFGLYTTKWFDVAATTLAFLLDTGFQPDAG